MPKTLTSILETGHLVFIFALLLPSLATLNAADNTPPIVGAIRWDGWYGEGGVVKQMEASLGQPKYHFRLPWFRVIGEDKVRINGDSQDIVEQEIAYAAEAGLNYWAFVDYWDEDPNMHIALNRYLRAKNKKGVRFCFVEEGHRLDKVRTQGWKRLVDYFRHPDYQTVLKGRPLLFVFVKTTRLGKPAWDELKRQAIAAGLKAPYLVLMGWNPEQDAEDMTALGFDAVSAYARSSSYSVEQPSFAEQSPSSSGPAGKSAEPCTYRASPSPAPAGTHARNERPPSWMKDVPATPDMTPPARGKSRSSTP